MEDIPARVVKSTMAIDVNVRVGYVDLEGLHDGRAAGNLLPRLNARKMVLAALIELTLGRGEVFTRGYRGF